MASAPLSEANLVPRLSIPTTGRHLFQHELRLGHGGHGRHLSVQSSLNFLIRLTDVFCSTDVAGGISGGHLNPAVTIVSLSAPLLPPPPSVGLH
jgi:hypothetical protein